jgi:UPF0755 protein
MHVYLVRHGETFLAAQGVHQSPNTPLSPRGKEQAESAAEYLRSVNPDLILTSGYTRAVETARVIGLSTGRSPNVHELFYEIIRPSSLYHKSLFSLATFRYVLRSFLKRKDPKWHYEDAENYTDLCARAHAARDFLESLSKTHKTVVVVSHTVFIRMVLSLLCENRIPGTFGMMRIFFGIVRFPHTGIVHLEYGRVAPRSKTCAWTVIGDIPPNMASPARRSPSHRRRRAHKVFRHALRVAGITLITGCIGTAAILAVIMEHVRNTAVTLETTSERSATLTASFPVGVDVARKEIIEVPQVDAFFAANIGEEEHKETAWFRKALGHLALQSWYQNLASLSERVLVIQPGERKEQVAAHFKKILNWDEEDAARFLEAVTAADPSVEEGKFFPGTYSVSRSATPEEVAEIVSAAFDREVADRYDGSVSSKVKLQDALIVASLLEREAYDFTDMREISGVIWNRLFAGMRLQIDATLQYAKGTHSVTSWWPIPQPKDKYIDSPYNTYLNEGLPPAAIANPSLAAILAALNPVKTPCMYYFHDKDSVFHCTASYEEHVALLKSYYGRGK